MLCILGKKSESACTSGKPELIEPFSIIPGKPRRRVPDHVVAMHLNSDEVIHGVDVSGNGGCQHTEDNRGDTGTVIILEESGVFAEADHQLQCALEDVVVERGTGNLEKAGEALPAFGHVGHGFAEIAIGLDRTLFGKPVEKRS